MKNFIYEEFHLRVLSEHAEACYRPNVCNLQNSYVKFVTPNVLVLCGEVFEKFD